MNLAALALIGSLLAGHPAGQCEPGVASQYAPGVMELVVRVRQAGRTARDLPADLPDVDGFVAAVSCADIGQVWTVVYGERVERMLVADCSGHTATTRWMQRNRILAEVDGKTAKRWGVVGRGAKVIVCRAEAPTTQGGR
jgi:hypothetical protein